MLAAAGGAELRIALDLLAEAHAARALDAAGHVGRDQRPEVLVLDHALALGEARDVAAVAHREILQLALPALIADRAIERMIDEQEFHGRALRGRSPSASCVNTFMPSITGVAQAGIGFGAFSTSTRHMRQLAATVSLS